MERKRIMYKIETFLELPIAHCLGEAYSGLCVGNVYRDKGQCDGKNDRYDLKNGKVLSILHGHNYLITVALETEALNKDGMVVDFKLMKKIIHNHLDQFDHSMILTKGNPLIDIYKKNYEENGIDFERSRLFVWDKNPTAEYMAQKWTDELSEIFTENHVCGNVSVTVEETAHNKVTYKKGF